MVLHNPWQFQERAKKKVFGKLLTHQSVLLQMPTAAGKTVTAASIIRDAPPHARVWFLCHRAELIRQASEKLSAAEIEHDFIHPDMRKLGLREDTLLVEGARVSVGSIDMMKGRVERHEPPDLVIIDEAHHVAAKGWSRLLRHLLDRGSKAIGLTATPERLDGKGLQDWFETMVVGPTPAELVAGKHIAPVLYFAPSTPDLEKARLKAGGHDYRQEDAEKVMNDRVLIGKATSEYHRLAPGSRAIVFAVSLKHAESLAEEFNAAGVPAMVVHGGLKADDRNEAARKLNSGDIKVIVNVEVYTEGFDAPEVDTIILCRPTRSLTLYLQMVGRGRRYREGKTLKVLDHAGIYEFLGHPDYPHEWSLEGGAVERMVRKACEQGLRFRTCPECSCRHEIEAQCPNCGHLYSISNGLSQTDGSLVFVPKCEEGFVSHLAFSKLIGCSRGQTRNLISRGLPHNNKYGIPVKAAMEWLRLNPQKGIRPVFVDNPEEYEQPARFAKIAGVSQSWVVNSIKKNQLPISDNGWVHIARGLEIVKKHYKGSPLDTNCIGLEAFCRKYGVKRRAAKALAVRHPENGRILEKETYAACIRAGLKLDAEGECQTYRVSEFAKLTNRSGATVVLWKKRGLPHDCRGRIRLKQGLEWVRDNTDIEIPPEAWPKDEE